MINWPTPLVHEIFRERCILFLGAGVSASSVDGKGARPLTWETFLQKACEIVTDTSKRASVAKLVEERRYLVALQAIKDLSNPSAYRDLLDRNFNAGFQPSDLHRAIYDLNARIVITTNFDKIYDAYCLSFAGSAGGFKTIKYNENDFADEIRSDTRLIVKAHGSIDQISDMIFTRAQYHAAKRDYPQFYEVLKALFLTNTVLFLGCGLEDPDILLLLEEVKILGRNERPHYAVTQRGSRNDFIKADWKTSFNIEVLEYGPDHTELVTDVKALRDLVNEKRATETAGFS
jgi:hypothetical protein